MSRITIVFLLLVATCVNSQVNRTRLTELVSIVTDVIINVSNERVGTIFCWFYTAQADPQPDDLLGSIQQQSALQLIPGLTLKQRIPEPTYKLNESYRMPTILIMDLRYVHTKPEMIPSLTYKVLKDTYALIFINRSEYKYLLPIWQMLTKAAVFNVIYYHTDKRESFSVNCLTKAHVYFDRYPSPMFPDQMRNVLGYKMRVSQLGSTPYAMFTNKNSSMGPTIDWINITTQLINATFDVTRVRCITERECSRNMFYSANGRPYDMCIDSIDMGKSWQFATSVRSVIPTETGLIAPRNARLEIHELFIVPFKSEVWIALVLLLIACALLIQLFPNQFRNNLILSTLCSFEKVALYRVKPFEKVVSISLIIFFFILLSAYESLFISLMTNRPRLRNPKTIQDLVEAGIKLELWITEENSHNVDEELRPLIRNVSRLHHFQFDGQNAYYDKKHALKTVMRHPANFDFESGESRYVMIDYSRWKGFQYHKFAWMNPLDSKFRFTQNVLLESGIYGKLKDQVEHLFFGARRHQVLVRNFGSGNVILVMHHLKPAWIVLGFGWAISLISFVFELGWFTAHKLCFGRNLVIPFDFK